VPLLVVIGVLVVGVFVVGAMLIGQNREPVAEQTPEPVAEVEPAPIPIPAPPESPAAPKPPDTPPQPPMEKARTLYAETKFAEAAATLRKGIADRTIPRVELRAARELMAHAYVRAGRRSDATRVYADLLKETPGFTPNPRESNAADLVAFEAAQKQVAAAETKPAPSTPAGDGQATFVVQASPFASVLLLDGNPKDANKSQFRFTTPPGRHVITIRHPSLGEKAWAEEVAAGETRELSHDFLRASAGRISVTATGGWAEIYIDGQPTQRTTPAVIEGVLPGEHVVSLASDGFTVEGGSRRVAVKVGEQVSVQFKLKSKK
jgi:hypothetical protein